ncbi:site-specific integrase [Photobacterium ganghwense]|uniref:site-specific integrase n=1 Tax=Photobacterium ganghwense TaxID=320778 RepID=UPI001A8F21C0|nr:site-specific integrase [Photobacterium ganghwense]QSV13787.1 site-specific integrase [Photobacterium ganghwense]
MAIKKKISASTIKQLTIEEKRLNDTEIPGFHARISSSGRIVYYLYYRLDGKQVNLKLGPASDLTPAQARDLAREKMGEVAKGNDVHAVKKQTREETLRRKHLKLSIFLEERYLPFLNTRNPKTASRTVNHLRSRFDFLLDKDLDQITAWEIEKWRSEQRKLGKAPATINYTVNTLKGALSRAVEWGLIERHDLTKVKAIKSDNTRVRYLTEMEEKRLRHALKERDRKIRLARQSANEHRLKRNQELYPSLDEVAFVDYLEPLVLVAMNTGLRRGELLNLAWADISLTGKYLTVRASNAKSKEGRTVPLNKEAFSALSSWRQQNPDSLYIYEGKSGQPLTDVKKPWALVLDDAFISDFKFHDLRHHFASKLVMAGVDLNTVRELLGHADLNMTLRYAHLAPEHKAAAVGLIG